MKQDAWVWIYILMLFAIVGAAATDWFVFRIATGFLFAAWSFAFVKTEWPTHEPTSKRTRP